MSLRWSVSLRRATAEEGNGGRLVHLAERAELLDRCATHTCICICTCMFWKDVHLAERAELLDEGEVAHATLRHEPGYLSK